MKLYFWQNPESSRDFIIGFLSFRLETNSGIAFGLPVNQTLLLIAIVIILLVVIKRLLAAYAYNDLMTVISLTLVVAGAFSNLIDRLRFGLVIDYIDVPFFTVFNLADVMISIGVAILILDTAFERSKSQF